MVDYCNLNSVVPPLKAPIPSIIEITNSIQSVTNKYSAVTDLGNMFCSLPISMPVSHSLSLPPRGYNAPLPGYPWGTSTALVSITHNL